MIAFASPQLPILEIGNQEVATYGQPWIERTITKAAQRAGHEKWLFAKEISQGIVKYLTGRFEGSKISISELAEKVCKTLEAVGFPDIAGELVMTPPAAEVRLPEIAIASGSRGLDLFLSQAIVREIEQAKESGVEIVRFVGMGEALVRLTGCKKRSNKETRATLEGELRSYIRMRAKKVELKVVIK